jgi:hypothetical protein
MTADASGGVSVAFASGVKEDVGELTAALSEDSRECAAEAEALKQRIAELLVDAKATRSWAN